MHRHFTEPGKDPFSVLEWATGTAEIRNEKGEIVFRQTDIEYPASWSQMALDVVASKYFRGKLGSPERETSIRGLLSRVTDTLFAWGVDQGYFETLACGETFHAELNHLLINQMASFNSPVWFNCGVDPKPQCSACFINSVADSMSSILDLAKTEAMLFKYGSGSGTNFSSLRSSKEHLTGGGTASGPVSFMKGFDAFAGVIKSGGRTRRAAKMVILDIDHPDIVEFVRCKALEERKAWALIEEGYDSGFNVTGGAYDSIMFQNANHSVRVTDAFMKTVEEDRTWTTHEVMSGKDAGTYRAVDLMEKISDSAHVCGDPGIQFDTTINRWHTCKNSGRIRASNPCSEYMFLDDSACNLGSLNLMKFKKDNGEFDAEAFRHAVRVMITAMEIIVDNASYPTDPIEANSHAYRPLGIGYANLGALLMSWGNPYDSDEGRDKAAAITAIMTGEAYAQSARLAEIKGPFEFFEKNREPMLDVIRMHREALAEITPSNLSTGLLEAATDAWETALALGTDHGYRNSQVSVLAPTGTIGFMMDCDTTGVEPDIALVKRKKLVGGGMLKYVNQTVPPALKRLGYCEEEIHEINSYLDENETIEGAPYLHEDHVPVFDCAMRPANGVRTISPMGHIRMMAAVQPFLSGAISKTVNLDEETTPEEIGRIYTDAWKLGLKAVAIYRNGCKRSQPLSAGESKKPEQSSAFAPVRRRLPDERQAITHKFDIGGGHEGYITTGMFEDGALGEIFLVMAKEGSVVSGLMDSFATAISMALQYGVPIEALVKKFTNAKFDPSGYTNNPQIPFAKSIVDYIFRWIALKFLSADQMRQLGIEPPEGFDASVKPQQSRLAGVRHKVEDDAPPCHDCGAIMVRNGACYKCMNCGSTSGCS